MSSPNTEKIKEKLDIVDVISSYIKVDRAGINYKARCPFHNEKTPSFFISPTRQSFYCFGCGAKGDIFSFVEQFEGLDFKGALEALANKAGIELKNTPIDPATKKSKEWKERLFDIMEEATVIFENNLKNSKQALDYLEERGVSKTSIKKWRLGLAKEEWRNLHDTLLKAGFSKEEMLKAGLLKKVPNESKFYDTFRNRVMFPISDSAGRVVAFSGRLLSPQPKEKTAPKYLNSPETDLFRKSEILYGLHLAKQDIRKLDYAILVEGQMDLVMAHQAGTHNTVASSGTALSINHLQKIGRLSNRLVLALDSDEAGLSATKRVAELALPLGMEIKVAVLEEGEDPASITKKDPQIWKDAVRNSKHFTDFILEKASTGKEGGRLTREVMKTVLPLVPLIKNEIEKSQFIKKIALKIRVTEKEVGEEIEKIIRNQPSQKNGALQSADHSGIDRLHFEIERMGFKLEMNADDVVLKNKKFKDLKLELQKISSILDTENLSKEERGEMETKIGEIQKKIRELELKN